MKQLLRVLLIGSVILSFGCKEEPVYDPANLTGHWEVYAAERNGKETTLLNGAVFLFEENGTMQTNVTGQEHRGTFQINKATIEYTGESPMQFKVTSLQGDTMSLSTELEGMRFMFDLQRTTTESQ